MSLAAYNTPDIVLIWNDYWPIAIVIAGGLGWFWRREIKRWRHDLLEEIQRATKPIQPTSNGGLSLPDLHKKVDDLADKVGQVQRDGSNTAAALLAHIANHRDPEPPLEHDPTPDPRPEAGGSA